MAPDESSPVSAALPDATIASVLDDQVARHADAPFVLTQSATLTYGVVDRQSRALAAALSSLRVRRGERIALILPAWPEFKPDTARHLEFGSTIEAGSHLHRDRMALWDRFFEVTQP